MVYDLLWKQNKSNSITFFLAGACCVKKTIYHLDILLTFLQNNIQETV